MIFIHSNFQCELCLHSCSSDTRATRNLADSLFERMAHAECGECGECGEAECETVMGESKRERRKRITLSLCFGRCQRPNKHKASHRHGLNHRHQHHHRACSDFEYDVYRQESNRRRSCARTRCSNTLSEVDNTRYS